ncbi:hypothetical protein AUF12_20520 [Enterococcus avium]|nr:hypothetical protein AUF12_20520 [Enterococcus avium]
MLKNYSEKRAIFRGKCNFAHFDTFYVLGIGEECCIDRFSARKIFRKKFPFFVLLNIFLIIYKQKSAEQIR